MNSSVAKVALTVAMGWALPACFPDSRFDMKACLACRLQSRAIGNAQRSLAHGASKRAPTCLDADDLLSVSALLCSEFGLQRSVKPAADSVTRAKGLRRAAALGRLLGSRRSRAAC